MENQSQLLTFDQQKILAAKELARSGSVRRAAKRAKVDQSQVKEWQRDASFMELFLDFRTNPVIRTITDLQALGPYAVQVLKEEMQPPVSKRGRKPKDEKHELHPVKKRTEADPRRIRAAKVVLEHLRDFTQQLDLAERVKVLESLAIANNIEIPVTQPRDPNIIDVKVVDKEDDDD